MNLIKVKKYLVGGAVRDKILNIANHDKDWVVIGSNLQQMLKLGFKPIGKGFPVFLHPHTKEEYALARTEKKIFHGYKGFKFYYSEDVSLVDDLSRRDLTINAMAEDEDGKIIDPFNGLNDIKLKILRHVSPAFIEDPLRVLRVARFAAKFNFKVADETMDLMKKVILLGELKYLSKNLIFREISKGLMTNYPVNMLKVLLECGALESIMPEIYYLIQKELLSKKYNQVVMFQILNQAVKFNWNLNTRYNCLVFDLDSLLELGSLNKRLNISNQIVTQTYICYFFKYKFNKIYNLSANSILEILIKCNVFRKKFLFLDILNLCDLYYKFNTTSYNSNYLIKWTAIVASITSLKFNNKDNLQNISDKIYQNRIEVIKKVLLSE